MTTTDEQAAKARCPLCGALHIQPVHYPKPEVLEDVMNGGWDGGRALPEVREGAPLTPITRISTRTWCDDYEFERTGVHCACQH